VPDEHASINENPDRGPHGRIVPTRDVGARGLYLFQMPRLVTALEHAGLELREDRYSLDRAPPRIVDNTLAVPEQMKGPPPLTGSLSRDPLTGRSAPEAAWRPLSAALDIPDRQRAARGPGWPLSRRYAVFGPESRLAVATPGARQLTAPQGRSQTEPGRERLP
jgi:hypothetical protein